MPQYAIMRVEKIKTLGAVAAMGGHSERTRETLNADPERCADNVRLVGSGDAMADVKARLDTLAPGRIRADSVLALDVFMGASKDWYDQQDAATKATWQASSLAWVRATYGAENVVGAWLHADETTPHIAALVTPITPEGRLNAHYFTGSASQLRAQQDSYARAVEPLGLERGVKGSVADHQTVKEFYAKIEQPTPAPEMVKGSIEVERPGRLVANPDKWASEQQERLVERLAPVVDAALTKATHYEEQAAKAEANIVVMQGQVRQLERDHTALREDYKALAAQVRAVPLESVVERLGGQVDRYNAHKYHLDGEHISITGERFYNHDRQQGGGGAIDLVMHAVGYDYREAVAYLRDTHGAEAAITAATWHTARAGQQQAQEIVEHAERPAFRAPTPDEGRWSQVRNYLVEQRQLPATLVDDLHTRGTIYADCRRNAVFLRQDAEGHAVGASLRGTMSGSDFKGLAAGTRRDEGYFSFTTGQPDPYKAPQIYLAESPIDAMSRAALLERAGAQGARIYISLDGHGGVPARQIDEGLGRRAVVHCGFDRDRGGDTMWERVRERYGAQAHETYGPIDRDRPPVGVKDWNEALQQQQEQAQGDGAGQHPHAARSGQRPGERAREDLADRRPS
jgi:hypothetical protein